MISFAEFQIALLGLLRLVKFDAGFAGFFDLSRGGARRSFRLALPLLPVSLLLMHLNAKWAADTDMVRVVVAELICYLLAWVAFPMLLVLGAKAIDRESRIYGAIAVYNWLTVLMITLNLPISVASYFGMDDGLSQSLGLIALGFVTACEFFAFRRLLEIDVALTVGLVTLDFVLSLLIQALLYGMARAPLF